MKNCLLYTVENIPESNVASGCCREKDSFESFRTPSEIGYCNVWSSVSFKFIKFLIIFIFIIFLQIIQIS